jgi:hypothetical protein
VATWLDEDNARAIAVLATATMRHVGRDAPVVVGLQRLLRERSKAAYEAACDSFDALDPGMRMCIAQAAPGIARRRVRHPNLRGLLGAINRG